MLYFFEKIFKFFCLPIKQNLLAKLVGYADYDFFNFKTHLFSMNGAGFEGIGIPTTCMKVEVPMAK